MTRTVAFTFSLILTCAASADRIDRRGGEDGIVGEIQKIEERGITIRLEGKLGVAMVVPWDRVRDFQAERITADRDSWMHLAMECWRARSRVERQDFELAEPAMERLFERFAGQTHEPALVAAEGLLRCRLARGDQAGAVIPWLETARIHRAKVTMQSYSNLPTVLDTTTWLCPALPPVFENSASVSRLAQQLAQYDARGDSLIREFAAQYAALLPDDLAAKAQPASSKDAGPELLGAIARCRATQADQRRDAAQALAAMLKRSPAWFEPWARFEIGMAMSGDESLRQRQAGLVQLMHVPARWAQHQPHLAAMALRRAAAVLQADGSAEEAASVLEELSRLTPRQSPISDRTP